MQACGAFEIGVVQTCPRLAGVRRGARRGVAGACGIAQSLGLLEVLWPASSRRSPMESQEGPPGVPFTRSEHEAEDEEEDSE